MSLTFFYPENQEKFAYSLSALSEGQFWWPCCLKSQWTWNQSCIYTILVSVVMNFKIEAEKKKKKKVFQTTQRYLVKNSISIHHNKHVNYQQHLVTELQSTSSYVTSKYLMWKTSSQNMKNIKIIFYAMYWNNLNIDFTCIFKLIFVFAFQCTELYMLFTVFC